MELSLSIASFPVDAETQQDMHQLLTNGENDYSKVLHAPDWHSGNTRGFAVLAYTEDNELIGFGAAADLVGLHHYEWSVFVHPDFRRYSIGSALADGVAHALSQRGAEGELAAFIEDRGAEAFLESLGYEADFKEIQLGVEPLESFELSGDMEIVPYGGQQQELESLMERVFDEEVLPAVQHNIAETGRDVWLMKRQDVLLASMAVIAEETDLWVTAFGVDPSRQGQGFGQAFLKWIRHYAFSIGKRRVLLDVETDNEALHFYRKAGFEPVSTVAYWKKAAE